MDIKDTTADELREMFSPRDEASHKGRFGHVLLVCGSEGMVGAAVLSARAALRSGAGLVSVALPSHLFPVVQTAVPEAMCIDRESLCSDGQERLDRFDSITIGCGLGNTESTYRLVEHILLAYRGPVIIDADGINAICTYGKIPTDVSYMDSEPLDEIGVPRKKASILPDIAKKRKSPVILTPHPGEAKRLNEALECGKYSEKSREENARILAEETGCIVVLKGHESLISAANSNAAGANPKMTEADIYINRTGNPGMATGGSGDVLAGIIGALTGAAACSGEDEPKMNMMSCVRSAVYIHGRAGDIACEEKGEISMTSMDIVEHLPDSFREITGR